MPYFIVITMSAENPTDLDHEIIKFIKWIRENYKVAVFSNTPTKWLMKDNFSYHDDIVVLDCYLKRKKNAKH